MIKINASPQMDQGRTAELLKEIAADPMGGWFNLPQNYSRPELDRIKQAAHQICDESEVVVLTGIGGSHLGHRALIEALCPKFGLSAGKKSGAKSERAQISDSKSSKSAQSRRPAAPEILYAGNSLSKLELDRTLAAIGDRDFSVIVISKSGETLEPKIAFDAFKAKLIEKYGLDGAAERIYTTTDENHGLLHDEAVENNYTRFVVPDNIGGRYSVLSAVGLLPLAVAGINVDELLEGANEGLTQLAFEEESAAAKYAWTRLAFGANGYNTEVFATFEPSTAYFNEWLKQLFGESEGKQGQGVFPASVVYTTDLHSLGQFMQDGRRDLWETMLHFPTDETNEKAFEAVRTAHAAGGIPVLEISIPSFDERGFGELIFFFEVACAMSGKLYGINPFDQPGVEAYKTELKKLLAAE